MISTSLEVALSELSTGRLQALVDAISCDEKASCTVGAWRPHCPMVLAGFDPDAHKSDCAERRFATAWDGFAQPVPRPWWTPACWPVNRSARLRDVQALPRAANETLAARQFSESSTAADRERRSRPAHPEVRPEQP